MSKSVAHNIQTNPLFRGVACSVVIVVLGFLSGISTASEIQTWYIHLQKPSFNPPNYLFGPVWSTLYILMGISLSIIIGSASSHYKKIAIGLFIVQFTLNIGWSYIFFNLHLTGWAFVEIMFMWVTILATIISFFRIHKLAGLLQIPYLLWVSFASILNYNIYMLN